MRFSLPLGLSEETSLVSGVGAAGMEVLWTDFSEQVLVKLWSSLWICTPTSDTIQQNNFTFHLLSLFSSCLVHALCAHGSNSWLFCVLISFFHLWRGRIKVLSKAVEIRRPGDQGSVSVSLLERTPKSSRDLWLRFGWQPLFHRKKLKNLRLGEERWLAWGWQMNNEIWKFF